MCVCVCVWCGMCVCVCFLLLVEKERRMSGYKGHLHIQLSAYSRFADQANKEERVGATHVQNPATQSGVS